jgi:hypothetical protein
MIEFEINNFCDYEASKVLKEVGFDELCIAAYYQNGPLTLFGRTETNTSLTETLFKGRHKMTAPTILVARKWFRENHGIDINVVWFAGKFDAIVNFYEGLHTAPGKTTPLQYARINQVETEPEAWNAAILKACEIVKANN